MELAARKSEKSENSFQSYREGASGANGGKTGGNAANIQGSGLGLHIVGKYAEMMNGQVSYKRSTEQGTTFTVTFSSADLY